MELRLKINCCTDGDFSFGNSKENLLEIDSPLYKNAKLKYNYNYEDYYICIDLVATGDANACRWAARDLMENLVCNIRTHKYYLVKYLYDLIIYPKEKYLWSEKDVDFYDCLSGNYDGTSIELKIKH